MEGTLVHNRLLVALGLVGVPALCAAAEFEKPVRLTAGGNAVRVEPPGFACPCLADVNGDGRPDLVVGQFQGGKMRVFKGLGNATFAAGEWLTAGGKVAEVPGVW
jgi:FG-GAP-like repeat